MKEFKDRLLPVGEIFSPESVAFAVVTKPNEVLIMLNSKSTPNSFHVKSQSRFHEPNSILQVRRGSRESSAAPHPLMRLLTLSVAEATRTNFIDEQVQDFVQQASFALKFHSLSAKSIRIYSTLNHITLPISRLSLPPHLPSYPGYPPLCCRL